ncbi:MAG TPA: isochorismatase family cysteine hydrolase [Atribacterota bacterium]|nr:isochorismatase family cysteine hydrolase [Atribacterota bacterium]
MDGITALLVIDMQYGLLQRNVFYKEQLIDNVNALLDFFHNREKPVFIIRHTNTSFSAENTDNWQIDSNVKRADSDILLNKTHSSVFKEKRFISLLKENSISDVVVTGLVSNGCVKAACLDARVNGLNVTLISDGHSTFHKEGEDMVSYWNKYLHDEGIQVISTAEFLKMN